MKCGDLGHKTALGAPCGQEIASDAKGCLWHAPGVTAEARSALAAKGSERRGRWFQKLPPEYRVIFATRNDVVAFAADMARRALTEDIDHKRIATALRAASVALEAHAQAT